METHYRYNKEIMMHNKNKKKQTRQHRNKKFKYAKHKKNYNPARLQCNHLNNQPIKHHYDLPPSHINYIGTDGVLNYDAYLKDTFHNLDYENRRIQFLKNLTDSQQKFDLISVTQNNIDVSYLVITFLQNVKFYNFLISD